MTNDDYFLSLKISAIQQALRDLSHSNGNDPHAWEVLNSEGLTRVTAEPWLLKQEMKLRANQLRARRKRGRIRSWRSDER